MAGEQNHNMDPVQFGRLIQSVETLTSTINSLRLDVDSLKETRSRGWGILAGVSLIAGGMGSASHAIIDKLLK